MIFNFLQKKKGTGALPDTRTSEEKAKDLLFEEAVATAEPVEWKEKGIEEWRKFPVRNQSTSGSCVAQTMAKMLGILWFIKYGEFVEFSASYIYNKRVNKNWPNSEGMISTDAFDIAIKEGITLESIMPSQNLNEEQINAVKEKEHGNQIAEEIFSLHNYLKIDNGDIETVASVIQRTQKPIMLWFIFNYDEWGNIPVIKGSTPKLRHSVTAVDFCLYKGQKAIIIEDSWGGVGIDGKGHRVITEDFFKKRNILAIYPIDFKVAKKETEKPVYTFNENLEYGTETEEIKILQDILKYEGLFPVNIDSTGYYGRITAKSVLAFQNKHKVPHDNLNGELVGVKTRAKLNELYS